MKNQQRTNNSVLLNGLSKWRRRTLQQTDQISPEEGKEEGIRAVVEEASNCLAVMIAKYHTLLEYFIWHVDILWLCQISGCEPRTVVE